MIIIFRLNYQLTKIYCNMQRLLKTLECIAIRFYAIYACAYVRMTTLPYNVIPYNRYRVT